MLSRDVAQQLVRPTLELTFGVRAERGNKLVPARAMPFDTPRGHDCELSVRSDCE